MAKGKLPSFPQLRAYVSHRSPVKLVAFWLRPAQLADNVTPDGLPIHSKTALLIMSF